MFRVDRNIIALPDGTARVDITYVGDELAGQTIEYPQFNMLSALRLSLWSHDNRQRGTRHTVRIDGKRISGAELRRRYIAAQAAMI
jgi:hypothetical protein